jgi:hypothetical protein
MKESKEFVISKFPENFRQERNKRDKNRKRKVKLSWFADDVILHLEDSTSN